MKKKRLFVTMLLLPMLLVSAYNGISKNNDGAQHENNEVAFKVVIDPGHGGIDKGATSASGKYEKDFTLSLSTKVKQLLEQQSGIHVFMTRTDDRFISQESQYRPRFANEVDADLFISIHGNTFLDPEVSGTETFYYDNNSRSFAKILQKHVVEATEFRDRGAKKKDLFALRDAKMPAALIEVGFLTNPIEESIMWSDDFQARVAGSIVNGIKEYKESFEKRGILNRIFE